MSKHIRPGKPIPGKGGFFSGGGFLFALSALIVIAWFVWVVWQVA